LVTLARPIRPGLKIVPAMARPTTKEAPPFGRRLAALRKSKGLTQKRLAELLGTTQKMVDYYERRAVNPSLALIEQLAEALEVSPADLLGVETRATRKRGKPGPTSQLQLRFERIQRLPRKDQEFIIRFLDTVLEKAEEE
jgi:transcriptional regulator with XRE-family HTH domain